MYMEPNDPKETAEEPTLTEDWQDPDFGGYPIEDEDDWPSTWCFFFLNMPKRYNHAYFLGFSVDSDEEENPTEQELLHALAKRITSILDPSEASITLSSELDGPTDTYMND